jgi:hypothetical protein
MKIFISWAGARSRVLGKCITELLGKILPSAELFHSEGISKGEQWHRKLTAALRDCDVGVFCVTPESLRFYLAVGDGVADPPIDELVNSLRREEEQARTRELVSGLDDFRLEFVREGSGDITHLHNKWSDGYVEANLRE